MTPGKFILLCPCHHAVPDLRVVTLCTWDGIWHMSSHWPFITGFSGLITYALKTYDREISVLATMQWSVQPLPFTCSRRASLGTSGMSNIGINQHRHHHRVACPVLDVAIPTSVLQA